MALLHRLTLGRPNPQADGPGHLLLAAVNASPALIAYARREADPPSPRNPHRQARVIVVEAKGPGAWAVWEFQLANPGYEGWPLLTFSAVEAFCVAQLHVPLAAIWYPASAPLAVEYETGVVHEMF